MSSGRGAAPVFLAGVMVHGDCRLLYLNVVRTMFFASDGRRRQDGWLRPSPSDVASVRYDDLIGLYPAAAGMGQSLRATQP